MYASGLRKHVRRDLVRARIGRSPLAVTAVPVTGTVGPRYTHIALGAEAGLTEYAGGYANVTDLHIIHKPTLRNRLAAAWPGRERMPA